MTLELGFIIDGQEHVFQLSDRERVRLTEELGRVNLRHLDQQVGDVHLRYMPVSGD